MNDDAEVAVDRSAGAARGKGAVFLLWVLVWGGAVLAAGLFVDAAGCTQIHSDTQFAGQPQLETVVGTGADECTLDQARSSLTRDLAFIVACGVGGFLFLRRWWGPVTWDSEPGRSKIPYQVPALAFAGGAIVDVVETLIARAGLRVGPPGSDDLRRFELDNAGTINALAWIKWILVIAGALSVLAVLLVWLLELWRAVAGRIKRRIHDRIGAEPDPGDRWKSWWWRKTRPPGEAPQPTEWSVDGADVPRLAICCSGGGIRSAAFSLGALSALEETSFSEDAADAVRSDLGLLGAADYLASVSGGGYTAAGWRIAASADRNDTSLGDLEVPEDGSEEQKPGYRLVGAPIIGDPSADAGEPGKYPDAELIPTPDAPHAATRNLYTVIRRRREFLRNGRGGLFHSSVLALLMLVWHFGLILAAVFFVSWPLGRVIDVNVVNHADLGDGEIGDWDRLALPVYWGLVALGAVLVVRSFTKRDERRAMFDRVVTTLMALTAALAAVLLALPWLLDVVVPMIEDIPGGNSRLSVILSGTVVATAFGLVRSRLERRAKYLGGVVLGIALAVFALLVMEDATLTPDGAEHVSGPEFFSLSVSTYLIGLGIYVLILLSLNPDSWSLQWIYRLRMSQTFSNRPTRLITVPDSQTAPDGPGPAPAPRPGPDWGVVQRSAGEQPRVSAYRDADGPTPLICCAAAREERSVTGIPAVSMTFDPDEVVVHQWRDGVQESRSMSTAEYEEYVAYTPGHRRQLGLIGAASLSGAAFAPSMGKIDVGTTRALLAALNLRLGVWLPNPATQRRSRPPFVNMFKEVLGQYDVDAPNLYVTDGGHWENLALVEMVRRRSKVIVSIDASGDAEYSHSALSQAIEIARVECNTGIEIDPDDLKAMKPRPGETMPARSWATGVVTYPRLGRLPATTGRILYVKAQRSRTMPLQVLRYASEDETFPNYSTADQFLADEEFRNLAILGRESMIMAVRDKRHVVFRDVLDELIDPARVTTKDTSRDDFWERFLNTPRRMEEGRYLDDLWADEDDGHGSA